MLHMPLLNCVHAHACRCGLAKMHKCDRSNGAETEVENA